MVFKQLESFINSVGKSVKRELNRPALFGVRPVDYITLGLSAAIRGGERIRREYKAEVQRAREAERLARVQEKQAREAAGKVRLSQRRVDITPYDFIIQRFGRQDITPQGITPIRYYTGNILFNDISQLTIQAQYHCALGMGDYEVHGARLETEEIDAPTDAPVISIRPGSIDSGSYSVGRQYYGSMPLEIDGYNLQTTEETINGYTLPDNRWNEWKTIWRDEGASDDIVMTPLTPAPAISVDIFSKENEDERIRLRMNWRVHTSEVIIAYADTHQEGTIDVLEQKSDWGDEVAGCWIQTKTSGSASYQTDDQRLFRFVRMGLDRAADNGYIEFWLTDDGTSASNNHQPFFALNGGRYNLKFYRAGTLAHLFTLSNCQLLANSPSVAISDSNRRRRQIWLGITDSELASLRASQIWTGDVIITLENKDSDESRRYFSPNLYFWHDTALVGVHFTYNRNAYLDADSLGPNYFTPDTETIQLAGSSFSIYPMRRIKKIEVRFAAKSSVRPNIFQWGLADAYRYATRFGSGIGVSYVNENYTDERRHEIFKEFVVGTKMSELDNSLTEPLFSNRYQVSITPQGAAAPPADKLLVDATRKIWVANANTYVSQASSNAYRILEHLLLHEWGIEPANIDLTRLRELAAAHPEDEWHGVFTSATTRQAAMNAILETTRTIFYYGDSRMEFIRDEKSTPILIATSDQIRNIIIETNHRAQDRGVRVEYYEPASHDSRHLIIGVNNSITGTYPNRTISGTLPDQYDEERIVNIEVQGLRERQQALRFLDWELRRLKFRRVSYQFDLPQAADFVKPYDCLLLCLDRVKSPPLITSYSGTNVLVLDREFVGSSIRIQTASEEPTPPIEGTANGFLFVMTTATINSSTLTIGGTNYELDFGASFIVPTDSLVQVKVESVQGARNHGGVRINAVNDNPLMYN